MREKINFCFLPTTSYLDYTLLSNKGIIISNYNFPVEELFLSLRELCIEIDIKLHLMFIPALKNFFIKASIDCTRQEETSYYLECPNDFKNILKIDFSRITENLLDEITIDYCLAMVFVHNTNGLIAPHLFSSSKNFQPIQLGSSRDFINEISFDKKD